MENALGIGDHGEDGSKRALAGAGLT